MLQLSFSSFDSSLLVRDAHGRYLPAAADDILEAARQVIDQKMQRGAEFTSPAAVKEYLRCTGSDCLDTVLQLRRPLSGWLPDGLHGVT